MSRPTTACAARRTTPRLLVADRRVEEIGIRLGRALRESRRAAGMRQADVAADARLSQSAISRLERGVVANADLETIAHAGAVVGLRLAAFFEFAPGASLPRDHEHLKRQELVIRLAAAGGWRAVPEAPIHPEAPRSRSIDVLLARRPPRERPPRGDDRSRPDEFAIVEIWDLLVDVGAAFRGLETKVAAIRRAHPDATVVGVLVLRGTHRNRELVARFRALFRSRLAGSSVGALRALTDPGWPPPSADALVWSDVAGTRLIPARLGVGAPMPGQGTTLSG